MIKLNLGCGSDIKTGWINIDNFDPKSFNVNADKSKIVQHDLRTNIPYGDNMVDYMYSQHSIEHISEAEAYNFLKECYRKLKPGGVLRISTPDLAKLAKDYVDNNRENWYKLGLRADSACQMVNMSMRCWGHLYLYDYEDLSTKLISVGFKTVTRKEALNSDYPELTNLETRPPIHDFQVEAVK